MYFTAYRDTLFKLDTSGHLEFLNVINGFSSDFTCLIFDSNSNVLHLFNSTPGITSARYRCDTTGQEVDNSLSTNLVFKQIDYYGGQIYALGEDLGSFYRGESKSN